MSIASRQSKLLGACLPTLAIDRFQHRPHQLMSNLLKQCLGLGRPRHHIEVKIGKSEVLSAWQVVVDVDCLHCCTPGEQLDR